jgi:hemolysin III
MTKLGGIESKGEHIADGVIHFLGVVGSLIAASLLVYYSTLGSNAANTPPLIIYAIGLIATFVFSAAYNMTMHPQTKAILRRLDHAAIFVMIAGTYTPLALISVGGDLGIFLAITVWVIAAVGVFIKLFFPGKVARISLALYLGQGWLAVVAIKPISEALSPFAMTLLVAGGLIYTAGVIVYSRDDWRFNRAIWHSFVLCAASIHYIAVLDIASIA